MGDIKAFADSTGLNLLEEGLRLQAKSIGKTLDHSIVTQSEQGARPPDGGTQEEDYFPGIPVEDFELTLSVEVEGSWRPGFRGSRETPEEPAWYQISRVMCKGKDITSLLSDDDIDRLMEALND